MRFMMLLPAPAQALEACAIPPTEIVIAMRKFNQEMAKANVLLTAEGLHPSSKGTRIRVSGGKRVVTDGPFSESKELIAGFWIIQVKSKEEAIQLAKDFLKVVGEGECELRQIYEAGNCADAAAAH